MKIKRILITACMIVLSIALAYILFLRMGEDELTAKPVKTDVEAQTPISAEIITPKPSEEPTPAPTQEPFSDRPEVDITSWEYTLVNSQNLLSSDYIPELTQFENGQSFDNRGVEAINEFISGARGVGLEVYITSSYRGFETQKTLFDRKVNQYVSSEGSLEKATEKAKTIVAYPGTSEHQLGLSCDIVDKYYEYMNESLAETELSKWMAANCAQYGFILRYPKDKTDITGVMFEPWHYRYVGKTAAEYIMRNGLCLEEFVALYK